jgi:hypothetical protein
MVGSNHSNGVTFFKKKYVLAADNIRTVSFGFYSNFNVFLSCVIAKRANDFFF